MTEAAAQPAQPAELAASPEPSAREVASGQLRGSALLLAGRVLGLVAALATQIVLVRVLSREQFGRLSYALAAVVVLQSLLSFGVDRADSRFLALYDVQGRRARLLGTFVVEAAVVTVAAVVSGLLAVLAATGALDGVARSDSATVLAVALLLVPLQVLDVFVVNALAVFARPRDVFVRRYLLEPGLRLLVSVTVGLAGLGAVAIGWGFVTASALASAVYIGLLVRLLRRRGLLRDVRRDGVAPPWRSLLAFSLPLLVANVTAVAATDLAALVLGHYTSASAVGGFRAVQPFAAVGIVVLFTFGTLFTPAAARLAGRSDVVGLRHLHWRTTAWIAVLSWPLFAVMAVFPRSVIGALLGERYEGSALVLTLLATASFVNAACGPNGTTVQILGRVRWMLVTNVVALVGLVLALLLLVPRSGATGAAVAVLVTTVGQNVAKQVGLGRGVGLVSRRYLATYGWVAAATVAAWTAAVVGPESLLYALAVVAVLSLVLLRAASGQLEAGDTFPELARLPLVRHVLRS